MSETEQTGGEADRAGGSAAAKTRRRLVGVVRSDKMQKTVVVEVTRRVAHPRYGKFVVSRTRFKAHDEKGQFHLGDRVEITEWRPLSRHKRWMVTRLVTRARASDVEATVA